MAEYENYVKLSDAGRLLPGTDVERVVSRGDERELLAVRDTYHWRRMAADVMKKDGSPDSVALWQTGLDETAPVSTLQVLEATQRLAALLTGRRWYLMHDAREAGDSWSEIGKALGMSKQGAQDWYRRKITEQEKYLPDFHDSERARAALEDEGTGQESSR